MEFMSVQETAKKWNISARSVRNYCENNRVEGAVLVDGKWQIPVSSMQPLRKNLSKKHNTVLKTLKSVEDVNFKLKTYFAYSSNAIEGGKLTQDEVRYIYETKTVGTVSNTTYKIEDALRVRNTIKCVEYIIERVNYKLNTAFINHLLKIMNSDLNIVPMQITGKSNFVYYDEETKESIKIMTLCRAYNRNNKKTLRDILDFHYYLKGIRPKIENCDRLGRLIILKECIRFNLQPFVIEKDDSKKFYELLNNIKVDEKTLLDFCKKMQDRTKQYLD